jgi:hypothetical protein
MCSADNRGYDPGLPADLDTIEFRPSKMPGMGRWRFELTNSQLALRNMLARLPVPPFILRYSPDIVVPLSQIVGAEVDHDPIQSIRRYSAVKGRKIIPGLNLLCVCYLDGGRQFFAVKGGRDALALDLQGARLRRLTVILPDPASLVDRINQASRTSPPGSTPP